MKKKKISEFLTFQNIIYAMLGICVLLLLWVFGLDELKRKVFGIVAALAFVFMGLGIVLIVKTYRNKIKGKLKWFYFMAGYGAIGIPVLSILHNVFYGLGIVSEGILALEVVFEVLHVAAFLISLIVCPLAFLVGAIGALVVERKKGKKM